MERINLLTQRGIASTLLFLSLTGISGVLIGKVRVFRIKLGIAGVLFSGLLIGHLGARFNGEVLHFVKEFGLILFVYSIGLDVGPRFLQSLRHNGLKLNFVAVGIVLCARSMTDPPALEFASSIAPVQAQSTAYATVYPLVMFLWVLLAQGLILIFL